MKFFIDQCVPQSVVQSLSTNGHTAFRLASYLPITAPDADVIAKSQELGCVLVSMNGDFADITTYPPADYLGIVSLQINNRPDNIKLVMQQLIAYAAANPEPSQFAGRLFIVEPHRIRIRS